MSDRTLLAFEELLTRTDGPPASTWNLFGPDDEIGMINLLTADRVLDAVQMVCRGAIFNLDLPLDAFEPHFSARRRAPHHTIFSGMPHHLDDHLDGFYLQGSSQIDGLRHVAHPDHGFYNGKPEADVTVGSPVLGINRWAERGIVGRAVLLDVDAHLRAVGEPIDQRTGHPFDADVLEATAAAQGVTVRSGDMVLLRTGWLRFAREVLTIDERVAMRGETCCPGIRQSTAVFRWLWDHQVPLLAADNIAIEAIPTVDDTPFLTSEQRRQPTRGRTDGMFHEVAIPLLGMALGELWDLDALADDCRADGVWEFLLVAKPLNLTGGVGSPANALAIK